MTESIVEIHAHRRGFNADEDGVSYCRTYITELLIFLRYGVKTVFFKLVDFDVGCPRHISVKP